MVLLAAILFLLVAAISVVPVIHKFQLRLADTYFRTAPPLLRPSPVVLVLIDDDALRRYGRWPWSRSLVAQLVRQLDLAGAQIIGLDILFSEPQSAAVDSELAEAMRTNRRTIVTDKIGSYPDGPRWTEPIPVLANAALGVGHSQAVLDSDGVCRRFPLRELSVDGPRLAFALEVARHIDAQRTEEYLSLFDAKAPKGKFEIVHAASSVAAIAFRRDEFHTVSAADVLQGRSLTGLRGRPVLVGFGPDEIADRLSTPLTGQMPAPGVEIHAQILDSVLTVRSLRPLPVPISGLLLFSTCLAAVGLFRNSAGWKVVAWMSCLGAIAYFIGWALFVLQGRIPPIGPMLLAVVFGPAVVYAADFVLVERSVKQQMSRLREWLVAHRPYNLGGDAEDIASNLDVLHEMQTQLGSLYELHEALLEATYDAIAVFGADGRLILQNRIFARIFGSHTDVTNACDLETMLQWAEDQQGLDDSCVEREARVNGELFAVRLLPLPPNSLSPGGGAIWMLSSLQSREERDRSRAEVLGFITHELRTPLTAIQGFSELMIQFPGSPHCANAPETIFRESKRLLALIHSYLDVLRLDAGARIPMFEEIDVSGIVHEVFEVLRPIAAASGMTLSWRGHDASIFGDRALLNGAILNVISNAIKYGDKGSEISVGCAHEGEEAAISVHNFGRPIDSRDLPNLFTTYYRGASDGGGAAGWGLGLAFVKRIAEKHGATVSVESLEGGTTFTIHFPVPATLATGKSVQ
jgi:CHASE2 domain-containing sensor protein